MRRVGVQRRRGSAISATAAALLTLSAASAADAQALDDKYWVEISGFFPSIDTKATVSRPGAQGTRIDVENDLGMNKHETLPAVRLGARFRRWVVAGEYYRLDRSASRSAARDLVFDGDTFAASAAIDSKMSSDIYRVTVGYLFLKREQYELGAAVGLHATDFVMRLRGGVRVGAAGLQTRAREKAFLAPSRRSASSGSISRGRRSCSTAASIICR